MTDHMVASMNFEHRLKFLHNSNIKYTPILLEHASVAGMIGRVAGQMR